ncbi:MAG: hypothetical protein M0006_04855 [Magnetospirillum sp.]|nr:hypothetical protein [Magnetospirillum sp.]
MKVEVSAGIEDLRKQFPAANITTRDDGQGGAYIVIEPIALGSRFLPAQTWVGFHIPAQYPYADIYPVFIGGDIRRADGIGFVAPVTMGHTFEGRQALQVSRRNSAAQNGRQKVCAKVLKVLDFLERLP